MGGRGSASGVSNNGVTYGSDYKTLFRVDNIKFVQPTKSGSTPVPLETMSANRDRVYALVNNKGVLKSIVFYDKSGKKKRRIDLDHKHAGHSPHVHTGYDNMHSSKYISLSKSDTAYYNKIMRLWKKWRESNG